MILSLYRLAGTVGAPVVRRILTRRRDRGKEDPERFDERFGVPGRARPDGPLIWIHAASVGESLSLLPLIERLVDERDGIQVLLTTGTMTSAQIMADRLPGRVIHQFIPIDRLACVRRFLDHWRPDLTLWAESEFWPNLLLETSSRDVPIVLVNGRISPKSYRNWSRFKGLAERLLSAFSMCLGQTPIDVDRLHDLGAKNAKCVGNLKFAAPPLPADRGEIDRLKSAIGSRPLWLAASTHAGEELVARWVHEGVETAVPGLLTIIVPRHADRGDAIAAELRASGARLAMRSRDEPITEETQIYLADTMGELGLFYRLTGIAFMGKSLVDLGGQNLIEAARLECAILHGPHMWNFEDAVNRMTEADAIRCVEDGDALVETLNQLFADDNERLRLATAVRQFAESEAGALERVMDELTPHLDKLTAGERVRESA